MQAAEIKKHLKITKAYRNNSIHSWRNFAVCNKNDSRHEVFIYKKLNNVLYVHCGGDIGQNIATYTKAVTHIFCGEV